jgi:hypothetical protein
MTGIYGFIDHCGSVHYVYAQNLKIFFHNVRHFNTDIRAELAH